MAKLLYVGQQVADGLKDQILDNVGRYKDGDFRDLEVKGDWRIPLSIDVDIGEFARLNPDNNSKAEIQNSLLVGRILNKLTPTLARENRVWVRLSHIECFDYARKRWLPVNKPDADLESDIRTHMFASTLTQCRDDHAVSRLWWNHYIASQMMPEDPSRALNVILARADIRMSLVERPGIGARPKLGRGVVRSLESNEELIKQERLFREFMKAVNLLGAGIAFEVWTDDAIDQFMSHCLEQASAVVTAKVEP